MLETAGTHQVQPKYDLFQNKKKNKKNLIPKHLEIKRKRQVLAKHFNLSVDRHETVKFLFKEDWHEMLSSPFFVVHSYLHET